MPLHTITYHYIPLHTIGTSGDSGKGESKTREKNSATKSSTFRKRILYLGGWDHSFFIQVGSLFL